MYFCDDVSWCGSRIGYTRRVPKTRSGPGLENSRPDAGFGSRGGWPGPGLVWPNPAPTSWVPSIIERSKPSKGSDERKPNKGKDVVIKGLLLEKKNSKLMLM